MYSRWGQVTQSRFFPYVMISVGLLLGLLVLKLALPSESKQQFSGGKNQLLPNTSKELSSPVGNGNPTPTLGFKAAILDAQAPIKNCTYTSQYWSEKTGSWPADNIIIGPYSYTQKQIVENIQGENRGTREELLKQFLTAALNTLAGADANSINTVLVEASAWLAAHPPQINIPNADRQAAMELTVSLQNYNSGALGPPLCPGNPATATPTPTQTPTTTPTRTPAEALLSPGASGTPQPGSPGQLPFGVTPSPMVSAAAVTQAPVSLPMPTQIPTSAVERPTSTSVLPIAPSAPTSTPRPSATQPLPTNTPVPASSTPKPANTSLPATSTQQAAATNTSPAPTNTPRPSNTPIPPATSTLPPPPDTNTPQPTNTPKPSHTPKPTHTPKFDVTPLPSDTPIPLPTNTALPPPSDTPVPATATTPQPVGTIPPATLVPA